MNIPQNLENSVVVIAGASSGFGRGTALELANRGAKVVVSARRTELLDELVGEIVRNGGEALAVTADVSVERDIQNLACLAVETYGRIDGWINNVGVGALGYFWEIPLEVHSRAVDVNLKGLIYGAHAALNQFIKQKGGNAGECGVDR